MQQAVQSTLERNITVSVPMEQIEAEIAARLKKLARTVKMQGFRPGHVPLKMVERHYGFQVRQEVVTDTVQKQFFDAVKTQNYRVAGYPRFQPVASGVDAQNVEYTATFEVYPDVIVGDLSKFEVTRPKTDVTDADIDRTIETLRKQRAKYEPAERAAKDGDLVNIDFEGLIAGQPFEGNKASNFAVVIGEGRMLPAFEAALTGLKAGEQKTFPLTFPQDYADALKGKTADFTVTVHQVANPVLPPLDGELAKQLGVETGDLERLRREVRQNVEKEVAKRIRTLLKEQVMDALDQAAAFEVPRSLLDQEVARMQKDAIEDLKKRGMAAENLTLPPDLFVERARRRLRIGLLVAELVKRHDLQPKPEQVRKVIEEHAVSFEQPAQLARGCTSAPPSL